MSRYGSRPDTEERAANQPASVVESPEHPKLASDVELVGEMKETGFEDRQWLIRRGDRFIQLTELLYRVAEHSDGERSLAEVAAETTAATEWLTTADNVSQLIETKLLPLGIIEQEDAAEPHEKQAEARLRSPLAINMRQRLIAPRYIEPVSGALQFLFAPIVLVPALVLIVLAHLWLYLIHGIGSGLQEMVLSPGLTLVVLPIVFVSGIFHEFGHAAALRYGGGKVRGMGFGLYLVYPALYTDTTDTYRLGRWGRVRTDLGGFYFHLLFALGLIGLFSITGQEILLVAVFLISLDIFHQCLPFVRFDGYWTLADLTGIPDFFSQMGAFLGSFFPGRLQGGNRLPNLKTWVKVVFFAYVLVTIPVLSFLVFSLVTNLPAIANTFWESLFLRISEFSSALDAGNAADAMLAVARTLLLALQTLGIAFLLYLLCRKAWEWSRPTPARRVIGTSVAGVIVIVVALFWSQIL